MKKLMQDKLSVVRDEYEEAVNTYYQKRYYYENLFMDADCCCCDRWEAGKKQHVNCKKNVMCDNVVGAYKDKEIAQNNIDAKKHNYAKKIFEILSPIKPKLKAYQTKKIIEWSDVFSENFESLSEVQQETLIELVEFKEGLYSFQNKEQIKKYFQF